MSQAVLTNAGQANAATGSDGMADAHKCSEEVSRLLEITTNEVLLLSTGVIGKRIKMEELLQVGTYSLLVSPVAQILGVL